MKARLLNKKITIQKLGEAVDDFGGIIEGGYQDFTTVWASINPVTGKEAFLSNTDFATVSHKIKIRYLAGIDASMRIFWNDRVFEIKYFINYQEANREIEFLCEEKINGN